MLASLVSASSAAISRDSAPPHTVVTHPWQHTHGCGTRVGPVVQAQDPTRGSPTRTCCVTAHTRTLRRVRPTCVRRPPARPHRRHAQCRTTGDTRPNERAAAARKATLHFAGASGTGSALAGAGTQRWAPGNSRAVGRERAPPSSWYGPRRFPRRLPAQSSRRAARGRGRARGAPRRQLATDQAVVHGKMSEPRSACGTHARKNP